MSSPFSIFLSISDNTATILINPIFLMGPQSDNQIKEGPPPASEAGIEALPVVKIENKGTDCAICLDEFEVDDVAKVMTCQHKFHPGCVEKWLRVNGSCPVCRCRVVEEGKKDGKREEGRREREMRIRFVNGEMVIDEV